MHPAPVTRDDPGRSPDRVIRAVKGLWRRFFHNPTGPVRTRLTREGFQFVFLLSFALIAAVIQNVNLLVLLAGALSAMVLLQWRLCSRSLHRLRLSRELPTSIAAGRPFDVELIVRNPRRLLGAWWLVATERVVPTRRRPGVRGEPIALQVPIERVLPGESQVVRYECVCEHRGEYRFLRPELSTRFPLCLTRSARLLPLEQRFLVHPAVGELDAKWREMLELPRLGRQEQRLAIAGGDGEFFGLRAFRSGDSRRLIHWRSSAKRNELLVRQFERRDNYECVILLDLTRPAVAATRRGSVNPAARQPGSADSEADIDVAIELVATFAHRILQQNSASVTLAVVDGSATDRLFRLSSPVQLVAALDRLATAEAAAGVDFLQAAAETLRLLSRPMPTIAVSLRPREVAFPAERLPSSVATLASQLRWIDVSAGDWRRYFSRAAPAQLLQEQLA